MVKNSVVLNTKQGNMRILNPKENVIVLSSFYTMYRLPQLIINVLKKHFHKIIDAENDTHKCWNVLSESFKYVATAAQ